MNGEIGIIGTNTEEEAKMAGIEEIEVGEDNTVTMAETLAASSSRARGGYCEERYSSYTDSISIP